MMSNCTIKPELLKFTEPVKTARGEITHTMD